MTKVVINACFGGFALSPQAISALEGKCAHTEDQFGFGHRNARACQALVEVVERLGSAADGPYAQLKIVVIPDGLQWVIRDYDGVESVEEEHQSWR